jgi:hypothetical protein
MIPVFPLFLAALILIAAPSAGWADQVTIALDRIVGKIPGLAEVKGKKIGVGEFPLTDGRATELGAYLSDQLEVVLTGRAPSGGFEVVTRGQLCQIIRENKLWLGDQFDPALHKKLGRLSQADLLATGRVTDRGSQLAVSVRLLDTETGKAVWADSLTLAFEEGLKRLLSRPITGDGCGAAIATTSPPPSFPSPPTVGDRLQVKVWADKPVYRIGETIRFGLRVNQDAYVTLINIGTSGEVTVIYPNRFHPDHFVRSGRDVIVPPPDSGFSLTVQAPTGFDQIRAIATIDQIKIHPGNFAGQPGTFRSLDRVQTRGLAVEIKEERNKVEPTKWAEEVVAVEVAR